MADYTAKKIHKMDAGFGGAFKRARAELGVESFGLAVIDLPADFDGYPEHDHTHDGQEEVFVALEGAGEVEIAGERVPLDAETVVRVGPSERRRILAGPIGLRVLVIGAVPGAAYEAPEFSRLGASDDEARSGPESAA